MILLSHTTWLTQYTLTLNNFDIPRTGIHIKREGLVIDEALSFYNLTIPKNRLQVIFPVTRNFTVETYSYLPLKSGLRFSTNAAIPSF